MGSVMSKDDQYPLETLCDHDKAVNCLGISDDNSLLVSGDDANVARAWSLTDDEIICLGILKGHTSHILCVAVNDTFLFTGSADGTLRKWDPVTCDCLHVYEGHVGSVLRCLVTGEYLMSAGKDGTVRAWLYHDHDVEQPDHPDDLCIRVFKGHEAGVCCLVVVPGEETDVIGSGDLVITGSMDNTARSWQFDSGGELLCTFRGHGDTISAMATDTKAIILFTCSRDKTVRTWEIATGACIRVLIGHTGYVTCLLALKTLLCSGDEKGDVLVWNVANELSVLVAGKKNAGFWGDFKPEIGSHLFRIPYPTNTINALKLYHNYLLIASADYRIYVVDMKTGERVKKMVGHQNAVLGLVLAGDRLLSFSTDTTIRSWSLQFDQENVEETEEEEDTSDEESEEEDKK